MAIAIKHGKFLIERSRRRTVGVVALIGRGGSVAAPVQAVLDAFAQGTAGSGKNLAAEKHAIRDALKRMAGRYLVLGGAGLAFAETPRQIRTILGHQKWRLSQTSLDEAFGEHVKK